MDLGPDALAPLFHMVEVVQRLISGGGLQKLTEILSESQYGHAQDTHY